MKISIDDQKGIIKSTIDKRSDDLKGISDYIWNNPELGFNEHKAHEHLTSFLEKEGFSVNRKTLLETSFIARYGDKNGLKVGVFCEYDSLPGIGHACGHNLIAEAGIATSIALKSLITAFPDIKLEIIVYGTPGEEAEGGKCLMIKKGVFDEADVCMMSHPSPYDFPRPIYIALYHLTVVFHGKSVHAAAPWEGSNALDAAVSCYSNVAMLRQQMKPTSRIHSIIVDGGKHPNIIPDRAELEFYIRGLVDEDMHNLVDKVEKCASGAASATGCTFETSSNAPAYSALKSNRLMSDLYIANAKSLGVTFNDDHMVNKSTASTDFGNISKIKPSIHPKFKISTQAINHTHAFTASAGDPENQFPTLNSAKSMAMLVVDLLSNPSLVDEVKKEFEIKF